MTLPLASIAVTPAKKARFPARATWEYSPMGVGSVSRILYSTVTSSPYFPFSLTSVKFSLAGALISHSTTPPERGHLECDTGSDSSRCSVNDVTRHKCHVVAHERHGSL